MLPSALSPLRRGPTLHRLCRTPPLAMSVRHSSSQSPRSLARGRLWPVSLAVTFVGTCAWLRQSQRGMQTDGHCAPHARQTEKQIERRPHEERTRMAVAASLGDWSFASLSSFLGLKVAWAECANNAANDTVPNSDKSYSQKAYSKADIEAAIETLQEQLDADDARHNAVMQLLATEFQGEIDHLTNENEILRLRYLLLHAQIEAAQDDRGRPKKKSAMEMYSDALDLLSKYNKDYNAEDHLPRIVVVGDQSAGKTSVLEMVVGARIFPRGQGQMMTKTPVQVTLGPAAQPLAWFPNDGATYKLNKEQDLANLRKEIRRKMIQRIQPGDTVSATPVTLHVIGPGLPRLVMVDLPGIIGHMTKGMAADTKDEINRMAWHYMGNPNAIIICVQDGSIDAERSNVADLVHSMDPTGERTVFVLTKTDLAEKQGTDPARLSSIMEGRLYRVNALGYYAVVTGRGDPNENIADIRQYEQAYFKNSVYVRDGALKPQQTTTDNFIKSVAVEFWRKVRLSVEEQENHIRAELNNKELLWQNTMSGRMMSRDELLMLCKCEVLTNLGELNDMSPDDWEDLTQERIWKSIGSDFFTKHYVPSARNADKANFTTAMSVSLSDWVDQGLPALSVAASQALVADEFVHAVTASSGNAENDNLFGPIKSAIVQRCQSGEEDMDQTTQKIHSVQHTIFGDNVVPDQSAWTAAADFMACKIRERANVIAGTARAKFGPNWTEQWLRWLSPTAEQTRNRMIGETLSKMISTNQLPQGHLEDDDIVTARVNVKKAHGIDVNEDEIGDVYNVLYLQRFMKKSLESAKYCRSLYDSPKVKRDNSPNGLSCDDVVMFWQLQELLRVSAATLRPQAVAERDQKERQAREVFDEIARDSDLKRALLQSAAIDLAEQVDILRHILRRLQTFDDTIGTMPQTAFGQPRL